MADITVSTNSNLDDSGNLSLTDGGSITVSSGVTLTINSDNKYSQQAAVPYRTYNYGTLRIDGTTVWVIPFNGGTSTIPTVGSTITGATSGATGELLGVYTTIKVAPSAAGGAMPATGFIKLRSKTGTFSNGENLQVSGVTKAVVNSATGGQRGWLNPMSEDATYNYAGSKFIVTGDWFNVGFTNGVRGQALDLPGVGKLHAGVFVETAVGSGTYEFYPNADTSFTATNFPASSTETREKLCYCTATGQVIFGKDGSSNNVGYLPPSGLNVLTPNIILQATSSYVPQSSGYNYTVGVIGTNEVNINYMDGTECFTVGKYQSATTVSIQNSILCSSNTSQMGGGSVTLKNSVFKALNVYGTSSFEDCYFYTSVYNSATTELATPGINVFQTDSVSFKNCTVRNFYPQPYTGQGLIFGLQIADSTNTSIDGLNLYGVSLNLSASSGLNIKKIRHCDNTHTGSMTYNGNTRFPIVVQNNVTNSVIEDVGFIEDKPAQRSTCQYFDLRSANNLTIQNIGSSATALNVNTGNNYFIYIKGGKTYKVKKVYLTNGGAANTAPAIYNTGAISGLTIQNVYSDNTSIPGISLISNSIVKGARGNTFSASSGLIDTTYYNYFTSDTVGRLGLFFLPKMNNSSYYTVIAGTPFFSGDGKLYLNTLNDEVEFEFPYTILGHTGFANSDATKTMSSGTATNVTAYYAIDTGSGYGAFKTATAANLAGETISASTGFKLKIRLKCTNAATNNDINSFYITTATNASDQKTEYPADPVSSSFTVSNLVSVSIVRIYKASDRSLLASTASSGATFTYTYDWYADVPIYIQVLKSNYIPLWFDQFSLLSTAQQLPVVQQADRVYKNP